MSKTTLYDAAEADKIIDDMPMFRPTHRPTGPFDFGEQNSVGLCVKRAGKRLDALGEDGFGFYLGLHEGRYTIGIRHLTEGRLIGAESYDTLEELKEEWQLD